MPISKGAVSPSATARPRIVPVRIPGIAKGKTWCITVCIFDAPTPSAASRIDGGTARIEARVAMITVGRVRNEMTNAPQGTTTAAVRQS